jgi:Cu-Zn family superoxide dismutase
MRLRSSLLIFTAAALAACSSSPDDNNTSIVSRATSNPDASATARLRAAPGSRVDGQVRFLQYGNTLIVRASLIGLPANRELGIHIHENGNCAAPGGHFNPKGTPHGRFGRGEHHAGDLPNIRADGEGTEFYVYETSALTVTPGPTSVAGRSVVITDAADDYKSQPDGKSGAPLACGVINVY